MKKLVILIIPIMIIMGCRGQNITSTSVNEIKTSFPDPVFTIDEANKLAELPLHCLSTQYPYKPGHTLADKSDLLEPIVVHPIFFGCFDWHSAAHGYWSLVTLLQQFPDLEKAPAIKHLLQERFTPEKVAKEVEFFNDPKNKTFERTYGWAWILKLSETLYKSPDSYFRELYVITKPLADVMVSRYKDFLPKLNYPVRVGEHQNTAFGLSMAYDYAVTTSDSELKQLIEQRARDFYLKDENCPINWEPSGYDFLSPCLEEVDIMRKVLGEREFVGWMEKFLPQLLQKEYHLQVGEVSDRTDGKLVHLDGLNFSRAWVFYGLADRFPNYAHLKNLANEHFDYSYPNIVGDSYEGGHWLGSFAIYALNTLHHKN